MEMFLRRYEMHRLAFNHVHQPLHRFNKTSLLPHLVYTSRHIKPLFYYLLLLPTSLCHFTRMLLQRL